MLQNQLVFFSFEPGKLTEDSPIDLNQKDKDFGLLDNFEGGKKYTANLSGTETVAGKLVDITLYFFVSQSKSGSLKSFSDLSQFLQVQKSGFNDEFVGGFIFYGGSEFGIDNNFKVFRTRFEVIPEPSATVSLLGIGALGAALALKRRKYLQ